MDLFPADLGRQIEEGISLLRWGGVIAFPTDTVYGLGAACDNAAAIERIYRIKRRPAASALPLLLADISQIDEVAVRVAEAARRLAEVFLPGGLTLVLYRSALVPDTVTGGGATVAVRVPAHPVALALIRGLGKPVVGTSANLSGKPSALTAAEVRAQLGDSVDFVIDGGRVPGGIESTVVDVTVSPPRVLRDGAVPIAELRKVCPEIMERGARMRIAIGCDHRGAEFKEHVRRLLEAAGHTCRDFGSFTEEAVDYPDIAGPVARVVAGGDCDRGVLICNTGIGMSIAANKVKGIRAALCRDAFSAQRAREHNDANVICLAANYGEKELPQIIEAFLNTAFEGGRHARRLAKIRDMEG